MERRGNDNSPCRGRGYTDGEVMISGKLGLRFFSILSTALQSNKESPPPRQRGRDRPAYGALCAPWRERLRCTQTAAQ